MHMWLKWLPWRFVISRTARARGFLDPVALMSRLSNFSQPSEVAFPIELLRAGAVLQARGLINSQAIQHNLDWVWPYWVEQQFDPNTISFIPRAFSLTHINLTHRNWTAVGTPGSAVYPLVDPRGLVTPFYDSWSIDAWVILETEPSLIPSRLREAGQLIQHHHNLAVLTETRSAGARLQSCVEVIEGEKGRECHITYTGSADTGGWLIISFRPCNPEGISFLHHIDVSDQGNQWIVNKKQPVEFDTVPESWALSCYREGDVYLRLPQAGRQSKVECNVGMATGAAQFPLEPGVTLQCKVRVPLRYEKKEYQPVQRHDIGTVSWEQALQPRCRLELPDERVQFLYDNALRTLLLLTPHDVFAGPYTYRRFWFRDAAFILYALLNAGFTDHVRSVLDVFPERQSATGYFRSQEGEWDSNGQVLWIMEQYCRITHQKLPFLWKESVVKAARWIQRKRLSPLTKSWHAGLLPAGFSAEHLGPNDYYFWDDFWSIAGLTAAANLLEGRSLSSYARRFRREARSLKESVDRSLALAARKNGRPAMPASPYRRMDSGAVGSLVAGYPLQLFGPDDMRLLDTASYLVDNCLVDGGFFHDMIHSGINAYLTLHIAQVLLRSGDPRYQKLMDAIARLASPTGQWPEAIHPRTGGGCMGDGQHVWAAAEWVIMVRNCFLREERKERQLILCSGIRDEWLAGRQRLFFGPAPTAYGTVSVTVTSEAGVVSVSWQPAWHEAEPTVEIRLPGYRPVMAAPGQTQVVLSGRERQ